MGARYASPFFLSTQKMKGWAAHSSNWLGVEWVWHGMQDAIFHPKAKEYVSRIVAEIIVV
jgi:hypothetical protein